MMIVRATPADMTTAYISHPLCQNHDQGPGHPESGARLRAIHDQLVSTRLYEHLTHLEAPEVSREQLLRVHTAAHIDELSSLVPQSGFVNLGNDIVLNPYSVRAALRAAGAVVLGVDEVMRGAVHNAFCAVRPPGHHAGADYAMGFCLFNNVAVGAMHALVAHGLERVAIVDFDVHHGNGTEDIFADEPRVMLCSTFQHPFYPYSGANSSSANIVNVPLPAHSNGETFREAFASRCLPALERFAPEFVLVSAGFDAHHDDELAMLDWREADYTWVTRQIVAVAQTHAKGRIVSTLEGGYALSATGRSVAAHIRVLAGLD